MDFLDGLRAFVATVETGSFTGAAERLGMSNRLTSKYVAELEQKLGTRLLQRTTRRIGLTPAGEQLMARAGVLLEEYDDVISSLTEESRGFSGTIRVSAPITYGELYVQEALCRFAEPHPDLKVDLRLSDKYVDLAAEGIDVAFRIGATGGNSLVVRRLARMHSSVVASPEYLAAHGTPQEPEDLLGHTAILDTNHQNGPHWTLEKDGEVRTVDVCGRFMVNSARVSRDLAIAGHGITLCPEFTAGEDIAAGRLVPVLEGWTTPEYNLNAVYLEGRRLPRKIRALVDFIASDMRSRGPGAPAEGG